MKKAWFVLAVVLAFAVALFAFKFSEPRIISNAVPADLRVRYSFGACHAEWGRTNVVISGNGMGLYESGRGSLVPDVFTGEERFKDEKFRKEFRLGESELLEMLNEIEKSGFYSLEDYYADKGVLDGSCSSLSVTKNNSTKLVAVVNTNSPAAFSAAADSIMGVAGKKTS